MTYFLNFSLCRPRLKSVDQLNGPKKGKGNRLRGGGMSSKRRVVRLFTKIYSGGVSSEGTGGRVHLTGDNKGK